MDKLEEFAASVETIKNLLETFQTRVSSEIAYLQTFLLCIKNDLESLKNNTEQKYQPPECRCWVCNEAQPGWNDLDEHIKTKHPDKVAIPAVTQPQSLGLIKVEKVQELLPIFLEHKRFCEVGTACFVCYTLKALQSLIKAAQKGTV